jgi:hypothetical protein
MAEAPAASAPGISTSVIFFVTDRMAGKEVSVSQVLVRPGSFLAIQIIGRGRFSLTINSLRVNATFFVVNVLLLSCLCLIVVLALRAGQGQPSQQ